MDAWNKKSLFFTLKNLNMKYICLWDRCILLWMLSHSMHNKTLEILKLRRQCFKDLSVIFERTILNSTGSRKIRFCFTTWRMVFILDGDWSERKLYVYFRILRESFVKEWYEHRAFYVDNIKRFYHSWAMIYKPVKRVIRIKFKLYCVRINQKKGKNI